MFFINKIVLKFNTFRLSRSLFIMNVLLFWISGLHTALCDVSNVHSFVECFLYSLGTFLVIDLKYVHASTISKQMTTVIDAARWCFLLFSIMTFHAYTCRYTPLCDVQFQMCRCILHICIDSSFIRKIHLKITFIFIIMSEFWATLEKGLNDEIPSHIKNAFR